MISIQRDDIKQLHVLMTYAEVLSLYTSLQLISMELKPPGFNVPLFLEFVCMLEKTAKIIIDSEGGPK